MTGYDERRRFITTRNAPYQMTSRTTYIIFVSLMLLSGGVIQSATLSEVQSQVFNASCTSCHSGNSPSQGLNLSAGAAYGNTVNVPSTEVASLDLVEPGDADNSYLMQKLEGTAQSGVQMPNGGPVLSTTLRQLVRDWIDAGAQNSDTDGDGIENDSDNCSSVANADQLDTDSDGLGNACDADDDGDNVIDSLDLYPLDSKYSSDDDGDGLPDAYETANGLNASDASDASSDTDSDSLTALEEFGYGTSPNRKDSDFDTLPDGWEIANGRDPLVADYVVDAGFDHTCALDDSGVVCWGYNDQGQADVPTLRNPMVVIAGGYHTCALDDSGVVCWGSNNWGQTDVPTLSNPTAVGGGWRHTCALDATGVVCWGRNDFGQTDVPATLSNPTAVSASRFYTCASDATGVVCWGTYAYNAGRTDVPTLTNPTAVSVGEDHTCALDDTGVVCWGNNYYGSNDVPTLINPAAVSAGGEHTCALDDTGVVCWGRNQYGQTDVPATLSNPTTVSAGYTHTCALHDTGVVCWGRNNVGQLSVPNLLIDPDGDGVSNEDGQDAFPFDATESVDTDGDGTGNNADTDDDDDGYLDGADTHPLDANEWADTDSDGVGDNGDNCRLVTNANQVNTDGDAFGNVCDDDDDGDGVEDSADLFPLDATETVDADGDGTGDNADTDDDNDGLSDVADAFPFDASEQVDSDSDGVGNNADAFPLDSTETIDTDGDGLGNNADTDDDGDEVSDAQEELDGTDPLNRFDCNGCFDFDIDIDGETTALTDGLLVLRHLFGFAGVTLSEGAVASAATRSDADTITSYLDTNEGHVDIDGNGSTEALTDGLLLLRYLFGFDGATLIEGAVGTGATRKTADEIKTYIDARIATGG